MHGLGPQHHWLRESLSIWFWGLVLPLSAAVIACVRPGLALLVLVAYPALVLKIYVRMRRLGRTSRDAVLYSAFCVLGKFPMVLGQIRFHAGNWLGRTSHSIDYKS